VYVTTLDVLLVINFPVAVCSVVNVKSIPHHM
jgi:hypothetical protein